MPAAARVLLVADRDADEAQLLRALRRLAPGAPRVTLLVPAYERGAPLGLPRELGGAWVAADWVAAADRAESCAAHLRLAGVDLEEAIVGEPDPIAAAGDAHHARGYDQIVFATPAAGAVGAVGRA